MMKPATKENLERLILRVDAMLAGMHAGLGDQPDYFDRGASPGSDRREAWWAWDKRRDQALAQIRSTLEAEEKARFRRTGAHDHFMTLAGVSSSCTSGWGNLLRNWKNAASRRIAKEAGR